MKFKTHVLVSAQGSCTLFSVSGEGATIEQCLKYWETTVNYTKFV